jgi:hypothetical protein
MRFLSLVAKCALGLPLVSCLVLQLAGAPPLAIEIKLVHQTAAEAQTKQQLERLLGQYPLTPWYFTRVIQIDETAIPHSDPVLTLHTRHLKDDDLLLSTFVHEELHRFLDSQKETKAAKDELRTLFPKIPVGYPDGAQSEDSGYEHLLVNFLEWRSDRQLMGELRARQIMEFWAQDHYRAIYRLVLDHSREIANIVSKHHLDLPRSSGSAAPSGDNGGNGH